MKPDYCSSSDSYFSVRSIGSKMKLSIFVVLLIASVANSENDIHSKAQSLLDKLGQEVAQAQTNLKPAVQGMIQQIVKLIRSAASHPESEKSARALETVEQAIPQVRSLLSNGPASRANPLAAIGNIVNARKDLVTENLANAMSKLQANGMGAVSNLMNSSLDALRQQVLKNEDVKNILTSTADGLEMAEQAVGFLNNLSGGAIAPLNMVSSAIEGLDSASDLILGREDDDTKNIFVSKILGLLLKAKNSGNQQAFSAVEKVCAGIKKAQAA